MKVTANIATYAPRIESGSLKKTIASLIDQVDLIRIYSNDHYPIGDELAFHKKIIVVYGHNLTDNGKFHALDTIKKPEIYLACDDDLIYPFDYRARTIEAIDKYGCIIAHHGRQLQGTERDYYKGHKTFRCLDAVHTNEIIDVAGTGVVAFRTDYFHPKGLAYDPRQRMSDLIFSLEAAKQKKQIGVIAHEQGWIKPIFNKETIYDTETAKGIRVQNEIANEIFTLNNGNK